MQRRKFLATVGSLTAGTAAAMGTGAAGMFTAQDRGMSVDVVDDSSGIIAFKDVSPGDVVNSDESGAIEIDLAEYGGAEGGSQGINIDSELRIGNYHANIQPGETGLSEDPDEAAFKVLNQWAGVTADLTLTFTPGENFHVERGANGELGSQLIFEFEPFPGEDGFNGGALVVDDFSTWAAGGGYSSASATTADKSWQPPMEPGEGYGINVIAKTNNPASSTDDNLSGTLSISANPIEEQS